MIWQSAEHCPKCNANSRVKSTRGDTRYRACMNPACAFRWRTQEVLQYQADEMSAWYTDQTEEEGQGLAGLMRRVGEMYWHAVALGRYLGFDEQEVHHDQREREITSGAPGV